MARWRATVITAPARCRGLIRASPPVVERGRPALRLAVPWTEGTGESERGWPQGLSPSQPRRAPHASRALPGVAAETGGTCRGPKPSLTPGRVPRGCRRSAVGHGVRTGAPVGSSGTASGDRTRVAGLRTRFPTTRRWRRWSGERDLNPRSPAPEAGVFPCSTIASLSSVVTALGLEPRPERLENAHAFRYTTRSWCRLRAATPLLRASLPRGLLPGVRSYTIAALVSPGGVEPPLCA